MKLAFIGSGYVGLVTGACMAEVGHKVVCADIDERKIEMLNKGKIPIYEPGLDDMVRYNVGEGRLSFTTDVGAAIRDADVVFSAVGTPEDPTSRKADLKYVYKVAEMFAQNLNRYKVLVNKSTVPVGTAAKCKEIITSHLKDSHLKFDVVSNPEFLREGVAIKDFLEPDRVVVGVDSPEARSLMERVYRPVAEIGKPILFTSVPSAEVIKYASNSFLAVKISFINEIANFCELSGASVHEVANGMGLDSRIGSKFLNAGIGYGGSCFPKDVHALVETGREHGYQFRIIEAADQVNTLQHHIPLRILERYFHSLAGKRVALWGLAFKPKTDDMREAPSLAVAADLVAAGATVVGFDPVANEAAEKAGFPGTIAKSALDTLDDVDALVICAEWDEFRSLDYTEAAARMKDKVIVDGRNILSRSEAEAAGFTYFGIGV